MTVRPYAFAFKTSAGWVLAEATWGGIVRLSLPRAAKPVAGTSPAPSAVQKHAARLRRELQSYFAGRPVRFTVPVDLSSLPEFTASVLRAASRIERGQVATYSHLARAVGKPGAARAVGQAMRRNPIPVVIPCHRVVGAHGLGGYSGGLAWKRRLLRLEGAAVA